MRKETRKLMDNSTPFQVIELNTPKGKYEVRLYWTERAGSMGYQVVTVIFKNGCFVRESRTSGCGYCKQSEAITKAFRELCYKPLEWLEHSFLSKKYPVGGNFYRVPKSKVRSYR